MKRLIYIIGVLILGSCSSSISVPDYSMSALKPLQAIEAYLESDTINFFIVEIINTHGGRYEVISNIEKTRQGIKLETRTKNSSDQESDTIMYFQRQAFMEKIEHEINVSESQLAIAGNYQSIKVTYNSVSEEFFTKRGFGLLNLLVYGESNIKK